MHLHLQDFVILKVTLRKRNFLKKGLFTEHYVLKLVKKERLDNLVSEKQFDSGIPY